MSIDSSSEQLLTNRYRLLNLIGKGAMGRVYRAEDTLLGGVTVAVKFLSQAVLSDKNRTRFEREATICALLGEKSIHIVRVRDYGVDPDDVPFYVMELLEGESLSELIQDFPLSIPNFLDYSCQICRGLQVAHEGITYKGERWHIVHRDLKPSNLIVVDDPTFGQLVKILDFGVAKMVQPDSTQTHTFMGTMAYASPEQMEGEELDRRSDIYSFGVMMYEMLTSELPLLPDNRSFGGWYKAHLEDAPSPFDSKLRIPQPLQDLVMKCLEKNRRDRPQNVQGILHILENLKAEEQPSDSPPSPPNLSLTPVPTLSQQLKPISEATQLETSSDSSPLTLTQDLAQTLRRETHWPRNKPQKEIVFPKLLNHSPLNAVPTLWVMLGEQDIQRLSSSTRYNRFLFLPSPHPMLLWITVVYNSFHTPRWLPCYLDLKTDTGQKLARSIGQYQSYYLLFFALEALSPQPCEQTFLLNVDPKQSKMLIEWANQSQLLPTSDPKISKEVLKRELEKLKPEILTKLKDVYAY
jgi:serine/threonine protein kinase